MSRWMRLGCSIISRSTDETSHDVQRSANAWPDADAPRARRARTASLQTLGLCSYLIWVMPCHVMSCYRIIGELGRVSGKVHTFTVVCSRGYLRIVAQINCLTGRLEVIEHYYRRAQSRAGWRIKAACDAISESCICLTYLIHLISSICYSITVIIAIPISFTSHIVS